MTAATTTAETTLIETLLARIEELERTLTERIATLEMALADKDALLQTLALEVKGGAVVDGALASVSLETERVQANVIGGKLVNLDTSEHLFAYVRAHDLFLGHSQRGKKRNAGDQGRALVDNGANLVVNFGPDWAGTVIGSNTQVNGDLGVAGNLSIAGKINGQLSGLDVAPTHSARVRCSDFLIGGSGDRGPERRALVAWPDLLEVNHNFDWKQCRVNGFTAGSSRDLKDNIAVLDAEKAKETLLSLQPTEFSTIGNEHRRFFGFIAEETPDTVASDDHKGIYLDGILSVLTRVVQAQQREIESLKAQMAIASEV